MSCEHIFIISGWYNVVSGTTAATFTCQKCLMSINNTPKDRKTISLESPSVADFVSKNDGDNSGKISIPARKTARNKSG